MPRTFGGLLRRDESICAVLRGGLGNQLFIAGAALEQGHRLGVPVVLDASTYFERQSAHPLELDVLGLEGMASVSIVSTRIPVRWSLRRKLEPRARFRFKEAGFAYDPQIQSVRPGTILEGYFQSWKYVPSAVRLIRESFDRLATPAWAAEYLERLGTGWTGLHVRRGDYANPANEAVHGLTTRNYFVKALEVLQGGGHREPVAVFSDNIEMAMTELQGLADLVPVRSPENASSLDVLNLMSRAGALIISNSTFSWWAAFLRDGAARPVVAPSPWFATSKFDTRDLIPPDWIELPMGDH